MSFQAKIWVTKFNSIFIIIWYSCYLIWRLAWFPVVLKACSIIAVLQLILSHPPVVKSVISSLCCYTGHPGIIAYKINLEPFVFVTSGRWPSSLEAKPSPMSGIACAMFRRCTYLSIGYFMVFHAERLVIIWRYEELIAEKEVWLQIKPHTLWFLIAFWQRCVFNWFNRPFSSSPLPLFQKEPTCKTILMNMNFTYRSNFLQIKLIFIWMVSHLAGLVLKQSQRGTRKWPWRIPSHSRLEIPENCHFWWHRNCDVVR